MNQGVRFKDFEPQNVLILSLGPGSLSLKMHFGCQITLDLNLRMLNFEPQIIPSLSVELHDLSLTILVLHLKTAIFQASKHFEFELQIL